jgi:hypothetical protein
LLRVLILKTHDLDDLGGLVVEAYPVFEPLVAPVRDLTNWGIDYRYPGTPQRRPEPSAEELSVALEHITRLADALEAEIPPG